MSWPDFSVASLGRNDGGGARRPARGALLLEVVVALTIMVMAMAFLGAELTNGLKMTAYGDRHTRAVELADRLLALLELDQELQQRVFLDQETDGDFGDQFRGYHWRLFLEETDVDGLGLITVQVLHQPDYDRYDQIEGAQVVRSVHLLKADPGRINLTEDLGLPEELVDELLTNFPAFGQDGTLDLQGLLNEYADDPLSLLSLLGELQQYLGDAGLVAGGGGSVSPDQLQGLMERFGQMDPSELQGALDEQGGNLQNVIIPGGGRGQGQGGRGGRNLRAPDDGTAEEIEE